MPHHSWSLREAQRIDTHGISPLRHASWLVIVAVFGLAGVSCAAGGQRELAASATINVFAAASLTDAFTDLGNRFEATNPDYSIVFNFGASSQLAAQIEEGAPVNVFAAADTDSMTTALSNLAGEPTAQVFARNSLAIAVEPGNPKSITGLADLDDGDLVVVVCAPEVPCGAYASWVLDNADVALTPDSYEVNVKGVVSKVALGEADAGIVYSTDVADGDGLIAGVEIPDAQNVLADYPIANVTPTTPGSTAFVDFVLGSEGQAVLRAHGFVGVSE